MQRIVHVDGNTGVQQAPGRACTGREARARGFGCMGVGYGYTLAVDFGVGRVSRMPGAAV